MAARAYPDLGQLDKVDQYAQKSVGLGLTGHSRTRARCVAFQAVAYLHMGEIDAAGLQVVNDAWKLQSGHVFGEANQLVAAITPFRTPDASEFLDLAKELLTARASSPPSVRADRLASHDDVVSLGQLLFR
jgi:hypothetical protein